MLYQCCKLPIDIPFEYHKDRFFISDTSLTDIPFAITDHRVLAELGYTLIDTEDSLNDGLMQESGLRFILNKYSHSEFIQGYSKTVQGHIMPQLDIVPNIHILDCTKLEVFLKNQNYEGSAVGKDKDGKKARGYKLSTIRGIHGDTGVIEDIRFGAIDIHDLELSRDMLYNSPVLKHGDILINDKGFISRDEMNHLKNKRGVDTYVPLKINMIAYKKAVAVAKKENKWIQHPNKNRKTQKIAFVGNLGNLWESDNPENDVDFNACVVWDTAATEKDKEYFVFITTDVSQSAKMIIKTYELRPEIEEDFRQIKDFWKIEDFKSTKLNFIAFHIVCTLFGYLFFQWKSQQRRNQKYIPKKSSIAPKLFTLSKNL